MILAPRGRLSLSASSVATSSFGLAVQQSPSLDANFPLRDSTLLTRILLSRLNFVPPDPRFSISLGQSPPR
ncbi:hypothetical protein BDV19DRAFT_13503 [Aspergillus venezuelensis]